MLDPAARSLVGGAVVDPGCACDWQRGAQWQRIGPWARGSSTSDGTALLLAVEASHSYTAFAAVIKMAVGRSTWSRLSFGALPLKHESWSWICLSARGLEDMKVTSQHEVQCCADRCEPLSTRSEEVRPLNTWL